MHYILSLSLQGFYLSREEQTAERPIAIFDSKKVLDCNRAAFSQGIRGGINLRTARMLAPDIQCKTYRQSDFVNQKHDWLDYVCRYSGTVEPTHSHAAYVDLSSHPRPEQIRSKLIKDLRKQFPYVLTWGASGSKWLADLSRVFDAGYLHPTTVRPFLRPLPLETLSSILQPNVDRLIALGFTNIGQIADLTKDSLAELFSEESHRIQSFVNGTAVEPVRPLYPPESISVDFHFDDLVEDSEQIDQGFHQLSHKIASQLSKRELQGHSIWLSLETETSTLSYNRTFSKQIRDARSAYFALKLTLGDLPEQPISGMSVILPSLKVSRSIQRSLDQTIYSDRKISVEIAAQKVQSSYGVGAIKLGSQWEEPRRKQVLKAWKEARGWL